MYVFIRQHTTESWSSLLKRWGERTMDRTAAQGLQPESNILSQISPETNPRAKGGTIGLEHQLKTQSGITLISETGDMVGIITLTPIVTITYTLQQNTHSKPYPLRIINTTHIDTLQKLSATTVRICPTYYKRICPTYHRTICNPIKSCHKNLKTRGLTSKLLSSTFP